MNVGARESGITVIRARGPAGRRAPLTVGEAQSEFIRRAMAATPVSAARDET